jgi:hypothetical protein
MSGDDPVSRILEQQKMQRQNRSHQTRNGFIRQHTNNNNQYMETLAQNNQKSFIEQNIYDSKIINAITKKIQQTIKREITQNEEHSIRYHIQNINKNMLIHMNMAQIIDFIAKSYVDNSHSSEIEPDDFDIHEILANEIKQNNKEDQSHLNNEIVNKKINQIDPVGDSIHISSIMGNRNVDEMLKMFNPEALVEHQHIVFDSKNRRRTGNNKLFEWDLSRDISSSKNTNTAGKIMKYIVSVELFPIRMPLPLTLTTPSDSIITNPVNFKLWALDIREFNPQGYIITPENKRFHFMFRTTNDSSHIDLNPIGDHDQGGLFTFEKPIVELSKISMQFYNPINELEFDNDYMSVVIADTAHFAATTNITCPFVHNLIVGDVVTISKFTTNNPNVNAPIIDTMNRQTGHAVTAIVSTTVFTINVDTSVISAPNRLVNVNFDLFVENRRFLILAKFNHNASGV